MCCMETLFADCRVGSEATNHVALRIRVCVHVSNGTGMQHISCECGIASMRMHEPRVCTTRESPCREAATIRKAACTATQKSGSKERRGHQREVL